MAFIAASCAPDDVTTDPETDPEADEDTEPDASVDGPVAGGELRVVDTAEPGQLHPVFETPKATQRHYLAIMEPFVGVNQENSDVTKDGLAVDWEQIDDLTWHFEVRQGVEFHNGEPLNAEAVAASFEESRFAEGSGLASFLGSIVESNVVDEHVVEFVTDFPDATVPAKLMTLVVMPPEHYAEVGAEAFGQAPIGTGPFEFEEWVAGERLTMVRNEDYWGEPAYLDRIVVTWAPETAARISVLEAGDADLATAIPPGQAQTVTRGRTVETVSQAMQFLAYNTFEPPFDDVRVREAVARTLQREAITDAIFDGFFEPWPNIYPPGWPSAGGHGDAYLDYDPDRARELIEEYEDEVGPIGEVRLHWPIGRYAGVDEVAEAVAGMIEDGTGLTVVREPMETSTFFQELFTWEVPDLHVSGFNVRYPHEDIFMRSRFVSDALARYCHDDPELDDRVNELAAITDPDERTEAYNEIERYWLLERVCWSPLLMHTDIYGISQRVQGFEPRPDELIDWTQIWLEE